MLTVLRYTGIRIAELERLRVVDCNLTRGQLRVSGKGATKRTVPMPPALTSCLRSYLDDIRPRCPDSDRLFANPRGLPGAKTYGTLPTDATDKLTRRHVAAAGLPAPHNAHRFRHSYATAMLRNGVSVEHIRRLLGHSDITITARYLHLDIDDLTDAVATVWPTAA